jgi:hypothetical protein
VTEPRYSRAMSRVPTEVGLLGFQGYDSLMVSSTDPRDKCPTASRPPSTDARVISVVVPQT